MASTKIPKDLNIVKKKIIFNLTARQLIAFALNAIITLPIYYLLNSTIKTGSVFISASIAIAIFALFLYQRDGMYLNNIVIYVIKRKFLNSKSRTVKVTKLKEEK